MDQFENGKTTWDLLEDKRSKNAVIVAEKYARGEATEEELTAAGSAARDVQSKHLFEILRIKKGTE